jgi:hypothetical protein
VKILRSRLFIAVVASTITALVVGGIAYAVQSPVDGNGVVHACYNPANGAVQLDVVGSCPKKGNTTPITWNAQGQPGTNGQSVSASELPAGDPNCANGGSQFVAANGTTYACNGAPGTSVTPIFVKLETVPVQQVIAESHFVSFSFIQGGDNGIVQLTFDRDLSQCSVIAEAGGNTDNGTTTTNVTGESGTTITVAWANGSATELDVTATCAS